MDERECRKRIKDDPLVERLFLGEGPVYHESNWPLVDATGAILGHGEIAVAALWDGKQVRGFVSADSLLGHAPITAPLQELLVLFSSSIGHLVALQLAQEEAGRRPNSTGECCKASRQPWSCMQPTRAS